MLLVGHPADTQRNGIVKLGNHGLEEPTATLANVDIVVAAGDEPAHTVPPVAGLEVGDAGAGVAVDLDVVAMDELLDEEALALAHAPKTRVDRGAPLVGGEVAQYDACIVGEEAGDLAIAAVVDAGVVGVPERADLLDILEAADACFQCGKVGHGGLPLVLGASLTSVGVEAQPTSAGRGVATSGASPAPRQRDTLRATRFSSQEAR